MAYFPPDHERPYDPLDGRDANIRKHHKILKPTRVVEDQNNIDSDRVPYEDLQRSPNGITGYFDTAFDKGVIDICSHELHYPHTRAQIIIRKIIKSDGSAETVIALSLPIEEENGN